MCTKRRCSSKFCFIFVLLVVEHVLLMSKETYFCTSVMTGISLILFCLCESSYRSHSTPQVDKADRVGTRLRRMSPATSLHSSLPGTPRSPRPDSSTGLNASAEETTAETNLALYKMLSGTFNPLQDKRKSHLGWEITTSEVKPGTLHDFRTLSRTITHVDPREVEGVEALLEAYFMQAS